MCKQKVPDIDALYANRHPPVRFTQNFLSTTVRGQGDGDYLSCPIGVLLLLTTFLGSGGARGKTALQIGDALKLTKTLPSTDMSSLREGAKNMYWNLVNSLVSAESALNARRVPVISISNGVFLKEDYKIKEDFKWSLQNDFKAKIDKLNFKDQSASMDAINRWIRNQTRELIPKFLQSPQELPADTKMALFNVFTLKGS
ncbi:unnamed protein product [Echinostoma caproni]|uniref:SERPIN domain-containing protein n=1 Tax=Echinostoma caproni TaxID=27848 RepID=A0A183AAX2_9TREM|nr:unnamed protein product [Echinostoma caproni]